MNKEKLKKISKVLLYPTVISGSSLGGGMLGDHLLRKEENIIINHQYPKNLEEEIESIIGNNFSLQTEFKRKKEEIEELWKAIKDIYLELLSRKIENKEEKNIKEKGETLNKDEIRKEIEKELSGIRNILKREGNISQRIEKLEEEIEKQTTFEKKVKEIEESINKLDQRLETAKKQDTEFYRWGSEAREKINEILREMERLEKIIKKLKRKNNISHIKEIFGRIDRKLAGLEGEKENIEKFVEKGCAFKVINSRKLKGEEGETIYIYPKK